YEQACTDSITATTCGSQCVDLTSNVSHCGACGNACGGAQTCQQGACVAPLVQSWYPAEIAVDGTYAYLTEASEVRRVPKGGGTAVTLYSGFTTSRTVYTYGLGLSSTHVYFIVYDDVNQITSVYRVPLGGGKAEFIASPTSLTGALAVNSTH